MNVCQRDRTTIERSDLESTSSTSVYSREFRSIYSQTANIEIIYLKVRNSQTQCRAPKDSCDVSAMAIFQTSSCFRFVEVLCFFIDVFVHISFFSNSLERDVTA